MSTRQDTLYPKVSYRAATVLVVAVVAILYLWCSRSANGRFVWNADLGGYYDLLGRGFASGHLYMPIDPAPELFQLKDPWDPVQNQKYRLQDAVLFNRRYYLYHGAAPALLLFAPWRLVTRHDLPESFAALVFCLGGYLFSCMLLARLLAESCIRVPIAIFAALLLALGVDQCVPYLLQRVELYEIAIASGFCFTIAGLYFFFRLISAERRMAFHAAMSGLCFGLAAGCRPNLVVAPFLGLAWLLFRKKENGARGFRAIVAPELIAFVAPLAAAALALCYYNFARFGNPFEFGIRYQLGDLNHPSGRLALVNVLPGLYYLTSCLPDFERVFPFFRIAIRVPFEAAGYHLPEGSLIEPIAGFLPFSPITVVALASPLFLHRLIGRGPARAFLWLLIGVAACVSLFIAGTGWSTQRYEMDFLPILVLIACYVAAAAISGTLGWKQGLITAFTGLAIVYGAFTNLALAIQGPYDSFVQLRPASYVRIARWFSPVAHFRPLLNPAFSAEALVAFPEVMSSPEPLITLGEFGSRYTLEAQRINSNAARLITVTAPTAPDSESADVVVNPGLNRVRLTFAPDRMTMMVTWNGKPVIEHHLSHLVTAPSQIAFGAEHFFGRNARFSGQITPLGWTVSP